MCYRAGKRTSMIAARALDTLGDGSMILSIVK